MLEPCLLEPRRKAFNYTFRLHEGKANRKAFKGVLTNIKIKNKKFIFSGERE